MTFYHREQMKILKLRSNSELPIINEEWIRIAYKSYIIVRSTSCKDLRIELYKKLIDSNCVIIWHPVYFCYKRFGDPQFVLRHVFLCLGSPPFIGTHRGLPLVIIKLAVFKLSRNLRSSWKIDDKSIIISLSGLEKPLQGGPLGFSILKLSSVS